MAQFGSNYVISSTLETKDTETKPTTSSSKAPQRGIVTIEYDNEDPESSNDDEDESEVEDTGEDTENEADSIAEEDNDENANDSDDGIEDDDQGDEDEDSLEEEEDSDNSDREPVIPLPKSRKHKLQIVKRKGDKKKKQKK